MSMLDNIFGFGGCYGAVGDQRAMSEKELVDMEYAQLRHTMQAGPPDYRLLQNYRPPVHIPQGWEDWVAMGDDLH